MRVATVPRALVVLTTAAVLAATVPATAGTATVSCRVKNATQSQVFTSSSGQALTDAIASADAGDLLRVHGTCVGTYTLDKDLTLVGRRSLADPTTLDADRQGRVLFVEQGVSAAIRQVIVTGGRSTVGGGGGIAVSEGAELNVRRSLITRNKTTGAGGGIVVGGTLRLRSSVVIRNHTDSDGGGIYNFGEVIVKRAAINRNTADGAGGGLFNEGSASLTGSAVRHNVASSSGGILNVSLLTLESTEVSDNVPDDCNGC
ncbi:MAG: hypothetical protein WEA10_00270 [Actinomycetota bacterium]